jgi:hypothetical protein
VDGQRIERTMVIEGVVTPAFIHNGDQFFFVNLPVYADGLVECWEMVDLPLFEQKLRAGWVATSVPDGEQISVYGLGAWTVHDGRWALSPEGLRKRVQSLVKGLNPKLENLYDCHGRTTRRVGKIRVSILGIPDDVPVLIENPSSVLPTKIRGKSLSIFVRHEGRTYLADLRVFKDGTVELGRLPAARRLSTTELAAAVREWSVFSKPPVGERVEILGLGTFTIGAESWAAEVDEILKEVADHIETLNGRLDSIEKCRAAFDAYLAQPSEAGRQTLKQAYENIPEHNRQYVGDMDTKDVGVRMIIYGEHEIESWSHRLVARAEGLPLPTISVPRPPLGPRVRLDLSEVDDWDSFFDLFAEKLGFPEFVGRNMNAWTDCMTNLDSPEAGLTSVHVARGQVLVLELEGLPAFQRRCPEQYAALIECAAFVNWRRLEKGEPAVLTLSFAT